ncbi:MAG TPA: hypothetical protein VFJ92_02805 [Gemmatimonadales bacterium]|nr:hypothetical protein [Gemmatimonadales bacterium]
MPRNTLRLLLAAALTVVPQSLTAQGAPSAPARTQPLDPTNRDTTCSACEDFYRWVNGGWIARTSIPSDQPWWSAFHELQERNYNDLHGLLDEAAKQARTTKDVYTAPMPSGSTAPWRTCRSSPRRSVASRVIRWCGRTARA